MKTSPSDPRAFQITDPRALQLSHYSAMAQKYADALRHGMDTLEDWRYVPPRGDDWREWRGATKVWAIDARYRWAYIREADLDLGKGPFYCPQCEARPGSGWFVANCLPCDWEGYLRDEALDRARAFGRRFVQAGWPERLGLKAKVAA